MLKMIKMDLYRFFHSMSIWITLFADIVLAVLSIILVYTMANNSASIQIYSDVGTLLAAQINGGIMMILCTVSVTIFVNAKYKGGFIKNIANYLFHREMLIISDVIMLALVCALHFFVYSACTIGAWEAILGNAFISFPVYAIMRLLIIQFVLHWSFCCLLLLCYMLTNSATFTIAAGILISFKILNIIYVLVRHFTNWNLAKYMLDYNIFQVGIESTESTYTRTAVVGVVFLLVEIMLSCFVMSKKDIK